MSAMPRPIVEPASEVVLDVQDLSVDIATPHGLLRAVRNVSFQVRRARDSVHRR